MSKSFLPRKWPSSPSLVLRNYISGCWRKIIQLLIVMRARSVFNACKSRRSQSSPQFRIFEFAYINFALRGIQLNRFIGSRSGPLFIRHMLLNRIYSFRPDCIGRGSLGGSFILILSKSIFTAPTPGCL